VYDLLLMCVCVCVCVILVNRVVLAIDWTSLLPGMSESLVYPAKILPGSKKGIQFTLFFSCSSFLFSLNKTCKHSQLALAARTHTHSKIPADSFC